MALRYFWGFFGFPTFSVANVIVDVEPIFVMFLHLDYPLHGFFHSFVGGTLVELLLAWVMSKIRGRFSVWLSFFKLEQKSSFRSILLASLSGVYIHILLDSRMHTDIKPFYPLDFNPFLSSSTPTGLWVHMLCVWCFMGAAVVYIIRLFLIWRKAARYNIFKFRYSTLFSGGKIGSAC